MFRKFLLAALIGMFVLGIRAQTTEFTYQGSLKTSGAAASGSHDFEFALFDALTDGNQLGLIVLNNISVTNGVFAAKLDFGNQFGGADRFLAISVRQTGGGAFIPLSPRQLMNSAPYSVKSLNTDMATNATQLGGVAAGQYVLTTDPRMTDSRMPLAGSADYVQNRTTQQALADFNISGNGTAAGTLTGGIVNATTQYDIDGQRVLLSTGPSANLFVGHSTGTVNTGGGNSFIGRTTGFSNTTGSRNSFVGHAAGANNTTGSDNSFVGHQAGLTNTSGSGNAFFGNFAGNLNTTASNNAFFGVSSGQANTGGGNAFFGAFAGGSNTTGFDNSFFGASAGQLSTTGVRNAFFGRRTGDANTSGSGNSFFGDSAGGSNTIGGNNSFFGASSGQLNTSGIFNSFFGINAGGANTAGQGNAFFGSSAGGATTTGNGNAFFGRNAGNVNTTGFGNVAIGDAANVGSGDLSSATAIGAGAIVTTSDTVVLGRSVDTVQIPGTLSVTGTLAAPVFDALTQFNIGGNRVLSIGGSDNFFAGVGAGQSNTGPGNAFVGKDAGLSNTSGQANAFFGQSAGQANTIGNWNAFFGTGAGFSNIGGSENAFFGNLSGSSNSSGYANSFFGRLSGDANTTGSANSFFGSQAGYANSSGTSNTFIGTNSGDTNLVGTHNTLLGANADVATNNLDYATAIGAEARVSSSNTVVLGRSAGQDAVQIPGNLNVAGTITGSINGSGITNLNASNIATGTLNNARLGVVPIANGGTGSATQNFVDLTNAQTVGGDKTFSNTLSAAQYNIGGNRVLSIGSVANNNIFAGPNTGVTGLNNSFVGGSAGAANMTGQSNTFVGDRSGQANTIGGTNSFVGAVAGGSNTMGNSNSFFGTSAGAGNATGSFNTAIGSDTSVGVNLTNATAIGSGAVVSTSNTIALGRGGGQDTVRIPGALNVLGTAVYSGTLGANIFNATAQYNIGGNRILSNSAGDNVVVGRLAGSGDGGIFNSYFGYRAGEANTGGSSNSFFGERSGAISQGINNSFFGAVAGGSNIGGGDNTIIGTLADVGSPNLNFATAIGAGAVVSSSNAVVLGRSTDNVGIGTSAPVSKLNVVASSTNSGDNTATFGAPNIGPNVSHLHFGTSGDWFIRSAASTGKVVLQDSGGTVGIGTGATESKLHVDGSTEILSTGNGAGFKFRDRASTSFNDDWVWYSQGNVARLFEAGSGDLLAVKNNGNVGIGTTNPTATLEVNGYTKLGSDSPSIRIKKITGTTANAEGVSVSISHGLDVSKIISVSVMISATSNEWYGPNYTTFNGYHFSWFLNNFNINITNVFGASAFMLSRPIKVVIIYEQ